MTGESIQELKEMFFGDRIPNTEILIHLAPFLSEPLLSRAVMIACAVQDPLERFRILKALALSGQISEIKKEELISAALDSAREIKSEPVKEQVLLQLIPSVSNETRLKIINMLTHGDESDDLINKVNRETLALKRGTGTRGILKEKRLEKTTVTGQQGKSAEENVLTKITNLSHDERDDLIREYLAGKQTRVVNTGFAPSFQADTPLGSTVPLDIGQPYYFWLDIGLPSVLSIEDKPTQLPAGLPADVQLKIAIFPFKDEIEITPGADIGELQLQSDGTARVIRQPAPLPKITSNADILKHRLFFPVKAPEKEGTFRLRCSIYYEQILIQSRVISAVVTRDGKSIPKALNSTVDYALSHTLLTDHLKNLTSHRLSLFLNNNGDGTHTLSFLGAQGEDTFKHSASIPATELKVPVENARKVLCKVSWGDETPWAKGKSYCYQDGNFDLQRLKKDLICMAIEGYRLYDTIVKKFTDESLKKLYELADLMLSPGMVQIAIKDSPTQVLPASLFYDYPLDTQKCKPDDFKLCETFISAIQSGIPLEESSCFKGNCPHSKMPDGYVCPSGFWGYRHSIGLPVSVADGMDVPPEITLDGDLQMVVGVATNLNQLNEHMKKLRNIRQDIDWHCSAKREEIINQLKIQKSHLIYFYCHGGLKEDRQVPYLQVGDGNGLDYIEGANLSAYRIIWDKPQPLVFINGCHTTALDPEKVINLVEAFVDTGSAGVIGTEITIFEQLACNFAETCLEYFVAEGKSIGDSVRMARLKLLKEGNPLGLVYTPFVLPSLRIVSK